MPIFSQPWRFHKDGNEELLPGEFRLIKIKKNDDASSLVLNPTPSDDPNDPLNWSTTRKTVNFGLALAVTLAFWSALSTQANFWQQMAGDLHVSFADLNNAQSGNLGGLAIGCIFFIPLTKKYGCRSTYVVSTAIMAANSWWSMRMTTLTELYITNLIYGLVGATNETIVQMTISDLFFAHQWGRMNALYFTTLLLGCSFTPMLAGIQAAAQGWRSSYVALSISFTILTIVIFFAYEETKYTRTTGAINVKLHDSSTDLNSNFSSETKAQEHSNVSTKDLESEIKGQDSDLSVTDVDSSTPPSISPIPPNTYWQRLRWITPTPEPLAKIFLFPFRIIFLPYVMFASLQYAFCVTWLVLSMATSSIAMSKPPYNFNTAQLGYVGLSPLIGCIIGSIYAGLVGDWTVSQLTRRNGGIFQPEFRLFPLLLPVLATSVGLIIFGVTTDKGMHWIFPCIGLVTLTFGTGAIGDAVFTIVIDVYQPITAEVFVVVSFFRNAGATGMVFALTPWMEHSGLTNMSITMGVLAFVIGITFVPIIYYGRRIRAATIGRYDNILKAYDDIQRH